MRSETPRGVLRESWASSRCEVVNFEEPVGKAWGKKLLALPCSGPDGFIGRKSNFSLARMGAYTFMGH